MNAAPHPVAGQTWHAGRYAVDAAFVPALGATVADLLAPQSGERILDLGCGDGALTECLMQSGADLHGIDASPELVAAARARGVQAEVMDGHALRFDQAFDAVFSNAALHWMREPDHVLDGVHRALKPGGRFVGEFGGHGNVAAIVTALLAALQAHGIDTTRGFRWFFPTADAYRARLERHGFVVDQIALVPRPTLLPSGMDRWLATFADPFLVGLPETVRRSLLDRTVALLEPTLRDDDGRWTADYVRLRFCAHRADHASSRSESTELPQ